MEHSNRRSNLRAFGAGGLALGLVGLLVAVIAGYNLCRIEVPTQYMAVLIKKTGADLDNSQELAPSPEYKGLQDFVLAEGRHFYNPWNWDWDVVPQPEIPQGRLGVQIRLFGDELPYGEMLAQEKGQKGIVPGVLRPGRHAINASIDGDLERYRDNYAYLIELHDPIVIPAGFRGVVTNLSGPMPEDPNTLLVEPGFRGVQPETYTAGTQYVNPYEYRINLVNCQSQRFNLSTGGEMGFPSKDGFWVTLDGTIEFRVMPEKAAEVFVTYNDATNDKGRDALVKEEITNKVILPNARSFCRLRGSDHSGKDFISGDTRIKFQEDFQKSLEETCEREGIEIVQALITHIRPPTQIADPVMKRQIAVQQQEQYLKEIEQQESEKELAIQTALIEQKQELVEADREVVKITTEAEREKEVALIEASRNLKVAELELEAAEDLAAAVLERGKADAEVIMFQNEAEAAGWVKAVEAFSGNGSEYARWVLLQKIAPAYRQLMVNTADSPLMDIFRQFDGQQRPTVTTSSPGPSAGEATAGE